MKTARLVIGLAGQVCAGKSSVANFFFKRGAKLYQADKIVHSLYKRQDVKDEVRRHFGNDVFDDSGVVDRKRLGKVVFSDPGKLELLTNTIIFPRTIEIMTEEIRTFREDPNGPKVLLLDAPTLFEADRDKACDRRIFVSAPKAQRERWALESRDWSAGELSKREARLMPEAEKRKRCEVEIKNNGTLLELEQRVEEIWTTWLNSEP